MAIPGITYELCISDTKDMNELIQNVPCCRDKSNLIIRKMSSDFETLQNEQHHQTLLLMERGLLREPL